MPPAAPGAVVAPGAADAAATDLNIDFIGDVFIEWDDYSRDARKTTDFNKAYGENTLYEFKTDLFEGAPTKARVRANIREVLIDRLARNYIQPEAFNTADAPAGTAIDTIRHKLDKAAIYLGYKDNDIDRTYKTRLVLQGIQNLINRARAASAPGNTWFIRIGYEHLYFNPDDSIFDVRNWDDVSMSTITFGNVPHATLSSNAALVGALTNMKIGQYGGSIVTGYTGPASGYVFNHNALPDLVKDRYEAKLIGSPVTKTLVQTRYPYSDQVGTLRNTNRVDGFFYPNEQARIGTMDRMESFICADGSLFIIRTVNHVTMQKLPATKCPGKSHVEIRQFYDSICKLMFDHGVYVHPFWAFRDHCNDPKGFEVQATMIDAGKDVPYELSSVIEPMSGVIYNHLMKPGTFPKECESIQQIVQNFPGNGYRALRVIAQRSHPVFQDSPATYLRNYPNQQKGESLLQFMTVFKDYLALRAYVFGHVETFASEHTQDTFVSSCQYNAYLTKRVRAERLFHPGRFQGDYLVDTLCQFLESNDSPMRLKEESDSKGGLTSKLASRTVKTNAIDVIDNADYKNDTENLSYGSSVGTEAGSLPDPFEEILDDLNNIQYPKGEKINYLAYCNAVQTIKNDRRKFNGTCIVCDEEHTFADCPTLKDIEFLRGHYIKFCQLVRKDDGDFTRAKGRNVNFVSARRSPARDGYSTDHEEEPVNFKPADFQRASRWG